MSRIKKVVNLTPHNINIKLKDQMGYSTITRSGYPLRLRIDVQDEGLFGHIPLVSLLTEPEYELPEETDDVLYVVSSMTYHHLSHRNDLSYPGDLMHDEVGRPNGARCLIVRGR